MSVSTNKTTWAYWNYWQSVITVVFNFCESFSFPLHSIHFFDRSIWSFFRSMLWEQMKISSQYIGRVEFRLFGRINTSKKASKPSTYVTFLFYLKILIFSIHQITAIQLTITLMLIFSIDVIFLIFPFYRFTVLSSHFFSSYEESKRKCMC